MNSCLLLFLCAVSLSHSKGPDRIAQSPWALGSSSLLLWLLVRNVCARDAGLAQRLREFCYLVNSRGCPHGRDHSNSLLSCSRHLQAWYHSPPSGEYLLSPQAPGMGSAPWDLSVHSQRRAGAPTGSDQRRERPRTIPGRHQGDPVVLDTVTSQSNPTSRSLTLPFPCSQLRCDVYWPPGSPLRDPDTY